MGYICQYKWKLILGPIRSINVATRVLRLGFRSKLKFTALTLLSLLVGALLLACTSKPTTPATSDVPALSEAPEEGLSRTPWVRERIKSLTELYNIAPEGLKWLQGYDLRQMVGRPGWFGSLGNDRWAGVGQAIPNSVLHEVSHSYYGAFEVTGRPDLSWDRSLSDGQSPALQQYRDDLRTFMFQPPDRYEPLRERFRNLPNLSRGSYPDLFHFGEADLIYTVAGSMDLIPSILRKYFDRFIADEGQFQTWEEAISWYLGLDPEDQHLVGVYTGIPHIPLDQYEPLKPSEPTRIPKKIRAVLEREERERLVDFAEQFDLIKDSEFSFTDAINVDRSFQFWRDYLRSMLDLHDRHPDVLARLDGRGPQLRDSLDFFVEAKGKPLTKQIESFTTIFEDPFMLNFSVLLPSQVLIELFSRSPEQLPLQSVEGVVGRFSQKLAGYAQEIDRILSIGKDDPQVGAKGLEDFLDNLSDGQQEKDLAIIIELMKDNDEATTRNLMNRLSDGLILRMLKNKASAVRSNNIAPERLLQALEITPEQSTKQIVKGLQTLLERTSGNFRIDAPFSNLAYEVIAEIGDVDPRRSMVILKDSRVPLLDFVQAEPRAAAGILGSDLREAAKLVANQEGYVSSPHGIVHGVVFYDPALAARIVLEAERQGLSDIVTDSLVVFAFDAGRLEINPSLQLSLAADEGFLQHLIEEKGADWLQERLTASLRKYREFELEEKIDETFIQEYRRTLLQLISLGEDVNKGTTLQEALHGAFIQADLPPLLVRQ